ncbi:MAG: hypothetical protein GY708_16335 [Actinomycetia bacterium]|nr:hypothetical protein [Actinomycetes bacterium]
MSVSVRTAHLAATVSGGGTQIAGVPDIHSGGSAAVLRCPRVGVGFRFSL